MTEEVLAACRELAENFKHDIASVHNELDGLAVMLKHGFETAPSKEDVVSLEREVASLKQLLESLRS